MAGTATNSKETSTQDVPKPIEFEALTFVDFSLDLLRRLPSKQIDWKYLSPTKFLKKTTEESNSVISGLEVARGFSLLGRIANSKTLKEIFKILDYACGIKGQNIGDYEKILEKFLNTKNKEEIHVDACRLFFEQRIVSIIDSELSNKIDSIYLENTLNDPNDRHVIKEMNFMTDPIGTATKWKMEMEIKKATYGRVQKVIRNDLAPNWRTRMCLVVASDDSFHWKIQDEIQYERAYFYDSFDKNDENKFWVNSIKAKCEFRTLDTPDVRIVEIFSTESESLIFVIPLKKKLSSEFLKKVKAENFKTWISKIQTETEKKIGTIMLPMISINTSTGLRSIFDNCPSIISSFFGGNSNVFSTPRIFCPHKAEFSGILGSKPDSIDVIFPLFEYYYKCKTVILTKNRSTLLRSDTLERKDPDPVPLIVFHDEKVFETESLFYQVKDDEKAYVVGKVTFNDEGLKEIKKVKEKQKVEKTDTKSLKLQKTQEWTFDEYERVHQRHHSVGSSFSSTPKLKQKNIENQQNLNQEKSRDENSNFIATVPEWKPAGDYSYNFGYDCDDNEIDNNPELYQNFQIKTMEADLVIDTPFLFTVVSENDSGSTTKKLIHFIGKFTGIDEIVDPTILYSYQQTTKTV